MHRFLATLVFAASSARAMALMADPYVMSTRRVLSTQLYSFSGGEEFSPRHHKRFELASPQILLSSLLFVASAPHYALAADVGSGAKLFSANCAGCHGGGNNYISEKKNLRRDALEKYQSLDSEKLQAFVQNKMPHKFLPFKQEFTDDNYADTIAYVLDQALNDKW